MTILLEVQPNQIQLFIRQNLRRKTRFSGKFQRFVEVDGFWLIVKQDYAILVAYLNPQVLIDPTVPRDFLDKRPPGCQV